MSLPNHSVIPVGDLLTLHLLLTPHVGSLMVLLTLIFFLIHLCCLELHLFRANIRFAL